MSADDVIAALKKAGHAQDLKSTGLAPPAQSHVSAPEALDKMIAGWSATGWIARQSGVVTLAAGAGDDTSLGQVVTAELVETQDVTHQIRRVADGWTVTTIQEVAGATHLMDSVKHIALEKRVAVYRRYWSLPEDGATEVIAWRLAGLEEIRP